VTCDRCSKVVSANRTEMDVLSGPLREVCDTVDLCEICCRAFQDWLSAPALAHPPAAKPGVAA
jgi:hypothetical protein